MLMIYAQTYNYIFSGEHKISQPIKSEEPKAMPSSDPGERFGFRTTQIRSHRMRRARQDVVFSQTEHRQKSFGDLFIPALFTTPTSGTSSQACGIS